MTLTRLPRRTFLAAAVALPFAATSPARAVTSDWAVSDGGRMRLSALNPGADGLVHAVLDIEPATGWKTYWRDPGASGMAPELDFSRSLNLVHLDTRFPVPKRLTDAGQPFIGYDGPASLAITFRQAEAGLTSRLVVKALVGVCREICLPFMADFALDLTPGEKDNLTAIAAVERAKAALPEAPSDTFRFLDVARSADGNSLEAALLAPDGTPDVILAAPPRHAFGEIAIVPDGPNRYRLTIPVLRRPEKAAPDTALTALALSGNRAMEQTLPLTMP